MNEENARIGKDFGLTESEMSVVEHLMQGLTNQEIANEIFRTEGAVKMSLLGVFKKVGVSTRSRLMALLWSKGWGFRTPSVKAVLAVGKDSSGLLPGGRGA